MKILYLTFYFEPDLGPGSFRNTSLVYELASQLTFSDQLHVVTTQPNRYQSFNVTAPAHEERITDSGCTIRIDRVETPQHESGKVDQMRSFLTYYRVTQQLFKDQSYDLVFASSSRLFTAFLGARLARGKKIPLFLDIRDLLRETILEMFPNPVFRLGLHPILSAIEHYTFGYAKHINLVSEGFRSYFKPFPQATYSYFTNGIDDEFLTDELIKNQTDLSQNSRFNATKTLLYAGNIGDGQGLHKIIPQAARQLGNGYQFVIIGAGSAIKKLEKAIRAEGIKNIELRNPIPRKELVKHYQTADYLFAHLNDLDAFKRVLPSKLFDYGATNKPIVAGVAGYAARFIREHMDNSILFAPGDVDSLVSQLRNTPYRTVHRADFVAQFQRKNIAKLMAKQILETANQSISTSETVTT